MSIPLKLYNLFPRYYSDFSEWGTNFSHIKKMGFNSIYINPIHYPGFSGSLYAPKDYYTLNVNFIDTSDSRSPLEQLKSIIQEAHNLDLKIIMDLVINHSAKDNPLTIEHSSWYVHDKNNNLVSPGAWENGHWNSWGDLAQFDHSDSIDKEQLWQYFLDIILYYSNLGFDGFRADAAYQIPSELWTWLIRNAKSKYPDLIFIAESLGCRLEESIKLAKVDFDYLCNSAKWWDFKESWFIDQYNNIAPYTKSIAFPESHDTIRIATEYEDINAIKRLISFTGLISSAWMITSGTEYGWKNKPDALKTTPADQEECNYNFILLITNINKLRDTYSMLNMEGILKIISSCNTNILILQKAIDNNQYIYFIINKSLESQIFNFSLLADNNNIIKSKEIFSSHDIYSDLSQNSFTLLSGECKVFLYG